MKDNKILILGIIVAIFVGTFLAFKSSEVEGSTVIGGEYKATSTITMGSSTMKQIFVGSGTLGSVVVAGTSSVAFRIWDSATSTSASSTNPINASTTIVQFNPAATTGTYTFDVSIYKGLVIELPTGFNGSYTVTFR